MTHNELQKIIWQWYIKIQSQYQKCKPSLQWISISKAVFKLRWVWQSQKCYSMLQFQLLGHAIKTFMNQARQAREPKTAMKVLEVRIPEAEALPEDIWAMLLKDKEKTDSCQDWRATRAFKSRLIIPSELTHTRAHGTQPCWSLHKFIHCLNPAARTHMQDWQQQSCLADSLQSLDKLAEFALCRSIIDRYGNIMYFLDKNTSSIHALLADL